MKSGQSIRRQWWLDSAMDATTVRAGGEDAAYMPGAAVLAPVLVLFLVAGSLGGAASSISSSSLARRLYLINAPRCGTVNTVKNMDIVNTLNTRLMLGCVELL